jgi:hypothetical protein
LRCGFLRSFLLFEKPGFVGEEEKEKWGLNPPEEEEEMPRGSKHHDNELGLSRWKRKVFDTTEEATVRRD